MSSSIQQIPSSSSSLPVQFFYKNVTVGQTLSITASKACFPYGVRQVS